MKKSLILIIAILFYFDASSQQFSSFEYFFNIDPGFGNGTPIINSPSSAEVDFTANITIPSNLNFGLNLLFIRGKTQTGGNILQTRWSVSQVIPVYTFQNNTNNKITAIEYFIDTDTGQGQGTAINFTPNPSINIQTILNLNLNSLNLGNHTLFVRTKDINNRWSAPIRHEFNISCNNGVSLLTKQSGNWNNINTWSCGRKPTLNDKVIIKNGHFVNIDVANEGNCLSIETEIGAVLNIPNGAKLLVKPQ